MGIISFILSNIIYVIVVLAIIFVFSSFRVVRPTQKAVIERFGKYKRFAESGLNFRWPFVENLIKVNVTERMMDIEPQDIITKDNLNARVDLVVYYKVRQEEINVKKSLYNVNEFEEQIVSLAQTTARNVIGDMVFKDVNSKRNVLNVKLAKVLDEQSDAWGVQIVRVEMKEITPPKDVQDTMNRVIKAENLKDAAKDEATATETLADGDRRAAIKKAEGIARGKEIVADGEAYRIKTVNEAANKYFVGNAQKLKQLEVTQISLKDNSKVILTEKGINPNLIIGDLPLKK